VISPHGGEPQAGVETREQLLALHAIGCDASQGFLIARPMSAAGVPGFLGDALPRIGAEVVAAVRAG
jgi:hypothetical protein